MNKSDIGFLKRLRQTRAARINIRVKQLQQLLGAAIEARLREADVDMTFPRAVALMSLVDQSGVSNAEMARKASVSPQTMHQILLRLERDGLLTRSPHPQLGRVQTTQITPAGLTTLTRGGREVKKAVEEVLDVLTANEQEQLLSLLDRCVNRADSLSRGQGA